MAIITLHDALVHELQDLYSAELQLVESLPAVINRVQSNELAQALREHLNETSQQVERLDDIFDKLGIRFNSERCEAMQGMISEVEELLEQKSRPAVLDAILIGAAQRIEHYEIAAYGTARAFAQKLGLDDVANILGETLDEEGNANKRLTEIAEGTWLSTGLNEEAGQVANG